MAAHHVRWVIAMTTLALALSVLTSTIAYAGPPPVGAPDPRGGRAEQVYERLLAPCCWTQTLDVHESDIATLLREEIALRLAQGESPRAIEDDLATRFGARVRAVSRDHDSRELVGMSVMTSLALGLAFLCAMAWSWVRRGELARAAEGAPAPDATGALCDYDEPLQRALRELDEGS